LILLAFLLPFSVYLLFLGILNRRPHPVLVPGTWDFVGLLFAASGFLLVGGPAVISSGSEGWRMFWLFGNRGGLPSAAGGAARLWGALATVYFAAVVGGAAYLLRRRREVTAVYNVGPEAFEKALAQTLGSLGLNPLRTGNLFVFGAGGTFSAPGHAHEGIQAPHHLPAPARAATAVADAEAVAEPAVLEVEPFALLRHVTLRWEPAASPFRREVEAELARVLAQTRSPDSPVGDWLTLIAGVLIFFNLLTTCGLALTSFLRR
jgi:hypothetical protein